MEINFQSPLPFSLMTDTGFVRPESGPVHPTFPHPNVPPFSEVEASDSFSRRRILQDIPFERLLGGNPNGALSRAHSFLSSFWGPSDKLQILLLVFSPSWKTLRSDGNGSRISPGFRLISPTPS